MIQSSSLLAAETAGPLLDENLSDEDRNSDPGTSSEPEQVLLQATSDLMLDGNTGSPFLVASNRRLVVYSHGLPLTGEFPADAAPVFAFELQRVQKVRTWAGTGSGLLQILVDGQWQTILRFSNALADQFHHVSRGLERIRKADPPVQQPIVIDPPRACDACGLRLGQQADSCPRCLHRSKIAGRVWELIRPQIAGTLLLCGLTVLGVVAELVPPKLQQYMVDQILIDHQQSSEKTRFVTALLIVVLALAASRVVLSVVSWFKGRLATRIGSSLTWHLRGRMVERLQQLAVAYYDRHQVGSLMSRVAYDSEVLQGLLHQLTGGFLLQILQLVGVGAMLVWLNPKLAFFTLIPVPLVVLGTIFFWNHVYPRYYRLWDSSSKQIAALSGMLSGIRVVKAFAQEQREYDRYNRASTYLRDSRLWVDHATSAYSAAMQIVFSLGGLIVWYVGGRDVIFQGMSLGELIAFLAYLAMFYAPLATLSNFTTWLTSFLTGSKRVLELLDTPVTVSENPAAKGLVDPRGEICFDNVTFGYDRHQPVIHNVSFTVAPGEMVGIVGRSGSGKTTMINLLGRFYDVQEGRILVDGVDIRDVSMQSLRQNIGIVFQDSFLFRGTIWDNLTYGQSECQTEDGLQAAKAAGAHDFICRSGLAYETALGESGAGLSGGEKQRLSIARTLLYNPRILVLDEATSNIDAEAEKTIQQALEVLIKGRTTIAIAHRLSTLRNADRIIVFDRGRLIEQGTHGELLDLDGTYARLVKLQTQISKNASVDKLATLESDASRGESAASADSASAQNASKDGQKQDATASPTSDQNKTADGGADGESSGVGESSGAAEDSRSRSFLQWLLPANCVLAIDDRGNLNATVTVAASSDQAPEDGTAEPVAARPVTHHSLFAVRCFPATRPGQFISLRCWSEKDDELEVGMIANLADWPVEQQALVLQSLDRRYRLPVIQKIRSLTHLGGYLDFDVDTDRGPEKFTMRWSQSQAVDFGVNGKLLIDTNDNRHVVPNVQALPVPEQNLFQQYIYW